MRRGVGVLVGVGLAVLFVAVAAALVVARRTPAGSGLSAEEQHGRGLFTGSCQQCHTLQATRAVGKVGPNLDTWAPWGVPPGVVAGAVRDGRTGQYGRMPARLLAGRDAADVAAFVSRVTGDAAARRGGPPPLDWR
jgi:mono/diheme cytochrome c family protein